MAKLTKKYRLIIRNGVVQADPLMDYGKSITHVGKGSVGYEDDFEKNMMDRIIYPTTKIVFDKQIWDDTKLINVLNIAKADDYNISIDRS